MLEAAGGKEALLLLEKHASTNLLLTDVVMPGMNGRKLADEARKRRSGLKVVFMTGYSRNAIVHQGRLDPGVELIQKPLRSEHLQRQSVGCWILDVATAKTRRVTFGLPLVFYSRITNRNSKSFEDGVVTIGTDHFRTEIAGLIGMGGTIPCRGHLLGKGIIHDVRA